PEDLLGHYDLANLKATEHLNHRAFHKNRVDCRHKCSYQKKFKSCKSHSKKVYGGRESATNITRCSSKRCKENAEDLKELVKDFGEEIEGLSRHLLTKEDEETLIKKFNQLKNAMVSHTISSSEIFLLYFNRKSEC